MNNSYKSDKSVFNEAALMAAGKEYAYNKQYDLAIEKFKKVISTDQNNGEAYFELGKLYYIQDNYEEALNMLKTAGCLYHGSIPKHHHLLLAKVYKILKKADLALWELKHILEDTSYKDEVNKELADIYPEYIRKIRDYNFTGHYAKASDEIEKVYSLISKDDIFSQNKLLSELEIAQKKLILNSKLRNLIVTLSTKCNLRCTMCEEIRLRWEIPEKMVKEIISYFPYLERVVWQGGEVFVLDYFSDLMALAGKFANLKQVITTNGLLINEQWADKLIKSNVDLAFSIDGVTADIYERIRKGAQFKILIKNLKRFNELKNMQPTLINTNLHAVIMRSNYHQLEDFIDFAKEYGFRLLALLPIGGNHDNPENIFYLNDKRAFEYIAGVLPKIKEKAERYGILLENRLPIPIEKKGPYAENLGFNKDMVQTESKMMCHLPWIQLYIDYDGTIRPDCVCKPQESIGHAVEDSLEEVWNNNKMQDYRKKIVNNHCSEICNSECIEGWVSERYLKFL
jgi:MoaA/NifB/PqqE/SkfB family radical SAM enzyme